MMKTWQTSVMRNLAIPSLAYHPHAFGHLLPSCAIFQFIHLSSILQLLSHTIHLSSAATSNYPSYHLSPSLLPPSFNPITSFIRPPSACHLLTGGTLFLGDLVMSIFPCHWHLALGYPHANPMSSLIIYPLCHPLSAQLPPTLALSPSLVTSLPSSLGCPLPKSISSTITSSLAFASCTNLSHPAILSS